MQNIQLGGSYWQHEARAPGLSRTHGTCGSALMAGWLVTIFFVTTAHLEVMEGALMRLQEVSWQGLNFPVACVTWPQRALLWQAQQSNSDFGFSAACGLALRMSCWKGWWFLDLSPGHGNDGNIYLGIETVFLALVGRISSSNQYSFRN